MAGRGEAIFLSSMETWLLVLVLLLLLLLLLLAHNDSGFLAHFPIRHTMHSTPSCLSLTLTLCLSVCLSPSPFTHSFPLRLPSHFFNNSPLRFPSISFVLSFIRSHPLLSHTHTSPHQCSLSQLPATLLPSLLQSSPAPAPVSLSPPFSSLRVSLSSYH